MTATLWSLPTTSDPVRLIPGSPAAVRADAVAISTRAATLRGTGDAIVAGTRTTTWTGLAHDTWSVRRDELRGAHDSVAEVFDATATALRAHADVLAWAQARAALAVSLWSEGHLAGVCAAPTSDTGLARTGAGAVTGGGASARAHAERILGEARADVAESAAALARLLDQLGDGLPDGRFHAGDFFAGIGSWVASIAGLLWQTHVLRALIDPQGWYGGVEDTWQANADAYALVTQDPLHAPAALLDTQTLTDRPGRWWGQLAPDLALTAVGGAEVGVRAFTGLRVAESGVLAVGESVGVASSATAPTQGVATGLLPAARIREALLTLPQGRSRTVRLVQSQAQIEALYADFSVGGRELRMADTYHGTAYELADGTLVSLRQYSTSGGVTIDIEFPFGAGRKVHVDGSS